MLVIMFPLSACALSSVQGTWGNQISITSASFNTVLANQSVSAQSFLAKSNIPPTKSFDVAGFPDHFSQNDYGQTSLQRYLQFFSDHV